MPECSNLDRRQKTRCEDPLGEKLPLPPFPNSRQADDPLDEALLLAQIRLRQPPARPVEWQAAAIPLARPRPQASVLHRLQGQAVERELWLRRSLPPTQDEGAAGLAAPGRGRETRGMLVHPRPGRNRFRAPSYRDLFTQLPRSFSYFSTNFCSLCG